MYRPVDLISLSLVEVRVLQGATARFDTIRNAVHTYITSSFSRIYLPSTLHGWEDVPLLAQSVDRIIASESTDESTAVSIEDIALQIHVYQPNDADAVDELATGGGRGDGEEVTAASVCELPSLGWEGLWESLIYSDDIKAKLLDYIYATVIFSDADVDCEYATYMRCAHLPSLSQSISSRGIVLCCCTVRLVPERRHCVARWHRNCPSVFQTGS